MELPIVQILVPVARSLTEITTEDDRSQDARNFMLSFQYWLGGSSENLQNFLLMLAAKYVFKDVETRNFAPLQFQDPVVYPDMGIWHPLAPKMFEDSKEYLSWYNSRTDISEDVKDPLAPCVGLVMQRTHIVTGDDAHYVAMVQEIEAMGARPIAVFAGGLDFSKPVEAFFWDVGAQGVEPLPLVDTVVSLTGFALVGGPARQDHPKAIDSLKRLNRPYIVALPLVFQTTEEWEDSELGLHPIQVALQIAIPELDGAIEPIIMSGRDGATGKAIALQDRVEAIAGRAIKWATLRRKPKLDKKSSHHRLQLPPGQRQRGNCGLSQRLWQHLRSSQRAEKQRLRHRRLAGVSGRVDATSHPRCPSAICHPGIERSLSNVRRRI
jgi:magnesium chelatase subunit H